MEPFKSTIMNLDEFVESSRSNVEHVTHTLDPSASATHPRGWEPGVVWVGDHGVGISKPAPHDEGSAVDHATLLREWGFPPEDYEIDGPLEYRQWDAAIGNGVVQTMRYYKAKIIPRNNTTVPASVTDLMATVRQYRKLKRGPPSGDMAFCVFLSDWQLGKGEGDGSEGTTDRLLKMIDAVEHRIQDLRSTGRLLGSLYVFGLGDMVEGCTGFYQNQEFQVDLTRAEQEELSVHILIAALKRWAPLFEIVVVAAVAGNHGQNRSAKGGTFTDEVRDNADTAVFKMAALVLRENPDRFGHVSFVFPEDRTTLCLNVAGIPLGVVHGNQFQGGGKLVQSKALEWWKGQFLGLQPVAHAVILVSGHFHHFSIIEHGPRTHFQVPAMDPGSRWVDETKGTQSRSGTLTFVVGSDGWTDQQVL